MRIEQVSCFLNNVLNDVMKGQLVPAAFQRPYVWSKSDVLALCESILEGYPIGSLLIWQPYEKADLSSVSNARLGPIRRQEGVRPTGMLLDGQNRLATFAWMTKALHDTPTDLSDAERATWANGETLIVDLAARAIRFAPLELADEGFTLPAYALLGGTEAMRLIREKWNNNPGWQRVPEDERDEGLKWWDQAQASFREARVVATYLEHATLDEARKAFFHICRVGVPMSQKDFDAAIGWAGQAEKGE